jgi:hypothetical protein
MASTIRPVRSFEERDQASEDSSSESAPSFSASGKSAFSSSVNSNASGLSVGSLGQEDDSDKTVRLKQVARADDSATPQDDPGTRGVRDSFDVSSAGLEIPKGESSLTVTLSRMTTDTSPLGSAAKSHPTVVEQSRSLGLMDASNTWDGAIGKAGLGKTGRVINKLVSDNEGLKRDLKLERLRAEESRQAARLLEDKMERLVSDYEGRLLEASVTKALLARKERQVESLQAAVELEKKRAAEAAERERMWKDEMEKVRADAKRRVEEASSYAALMEGRYNAISSHWRDQGQEVKKAMAKMGGEISDLLEERKKDDDRITTLRELCDQQDGNIRALRQQKEAITTQYEAYRAEQEEALRSIKTKARKREQEQEWTLKETKEVLDKLRWALNVKNNIEWAQ